MRGLWCDKYILVENKTISRLFIFSNPRAPNTHNNNIIHALLLRTYISLLYTYIYIYYWADTEKTMT
jgi:hypothetical protein